MNDLQDVRMLIIDEQRASLEAMRPLLEQDGFSVLSADNGPNGLLLAWNEHPDLILLNLMPAGLNICRHLRQFSSAPLIMFGSSQSADVVSALAAGADDYVLHPFSRRELMARIHAVLRRASTYHTPAAIA